MRKFLIGLVLLFGVQLAFANEPACANKATFTESLSWDKATGVTAESGGIILGGQNIAVEFVTGDGEDSVGVFSLYSELAGFTLTVSPCQADFSVKDKACESHNGMLVVSTGYDETACNLKPNTRYYFNVKYDGKKQSGFELFFNHT